MYFKKTSLYIIIILAVILFSSLTTRAEEVIVNDDHLNVRKGPGTQYEKINQVNSGEKYPVIQIKNDWVEIELPEGSGWVTTDYITIINEVDEDEEFEEDALNNNHQVITVTNENTHIRKGPSINEKIIDFVNEGTELTVSSENKDWYEIIHKDQKGYIFKSLIDQKLSHSNQFQNKSIVIDAGHGGYDVGAVGVDGTYEKDLGLLTTQKLERILSLLGADVLLTRNNDSYIRLGSRPILSNYNDTNSFISIHYNSFPELPSVTGIGSYYYQEYNKPLASAIQKGLIKATGAKDRDISFGDFQVIRQNYRPSALVELGFISNLETEKLLLTDAYQKQLVQGIVSGLSNYFTEVNSNGVTQHNE